MRGLLALILATVALVASGCTTPPGPAVGRVIDGDTLTLTDGQRIRLIGIDAPETDECGHDEAAAALARLAAPGSAVELHTDGQQPAQDKYGRTLAYISTSSTPDVGLVMITDGWALPGYRFDRETTYAAAAREAAAHDRGIHALCAK